MAANWLKLTRGLRMAGVRVLTLRAVASRAKVSRHAVALALATRRLTGATVVQATGEDTPAVVEDAKLRAFVRKAAA